MDDQGLFHVHGTPSRPFTVDLSVEGKMLTFEVDTGAAVTFISEAAYHKYFASHPLQESSVQLKTYTEERVLVLGEIAVQVSYGTQQGTYTLYVVKGSGVNLLGRDWLKHIRLDWKTVAQTVNSVGACYQRLLEKYSDVFNGELGTLKSTKAKLQLKPQAMPKFCKPRPVPFALKGALERELARLEGLGILRKVDHSDWAAPVVVVPKGDGCLRVCGDYKITINPVLVVDQYPLPKPEDLMAQLVGGQRFSKLDLSQAYQQVLLYRRRLLQVCYHKYSSRPIPVYQGTLRHSLSACLVPEDHGYNFTGYPSYHLPFRRYFGDWYYRGGTLMQPRRSDKTVTPKWVKSKGPEMSVYGTCSGISGTSN